MLWLTIPSFWSPLKHQCRLTLSDQSLSFCFRLEFLLLLGRMTLSCCSSYGAHSPKIQKSSAWTCLNADTAAFKLDLQVRIKENMAQNLLHFSKSYGVLLLFWRQQQVLPFTFKNHAHCCGRALMPAYVWENVDMLPGLFHASTAFTTLVCVPFTRAAHVGDARLCSQQEKATWRKRGKPKSPRQQSGWR